MGYLAALISGLVFGIIIVRMIRDLMFSDDLGHSGQANFAPPPPPSPKPVAETPIPASTPPTPTPIQSPPVPPRPTAAPASPPPAPTRPPAPITEPGAGPGAAAPDDLKVIKGIGPKLEGVLNENGVTHFRQIARWTTNDIATMDEKHKLRGRIDREGWVSQAQVLHREKYGESH